jgi:hypothetical protein
MCTAMGQFSSRVELAYMELGEVYKHLDRSSIPEKDKN